MSRNTRVVIEGLSEDTKEFFRKALFNVAQSASEDFPGSISMSNREEAARRTIKELIREGFRTRDDAAKQSGYILGAFGDTGYKDNFTLKSAIKAATEEMGEPAAQAAKANLLECCQEAGIVPEQRPARKR